MIQAMNTGHEGSMTTLHANGTKDALSRLQLMVAMSRVDLPPTTVRECIALAIPLIVQIARLRGGVRRVTSISELRSDGSGNLDVADIFRFVPTGVDDSGRSVGHFETTGHLPSFLPKLQEQGIPLDVSIFNPQSDATNR